MKKLTRGCVFGCLAAAVMLVLLVAFLVFLVRGCLADAFGPRDPIKLAAALLDTPLPDGTAPETKEDTGAGLPVPGGASDGYTWLVLKVPSAQVKSFAQRIATSPQWKPLPLPPELAAGETFLQPTILDGGKGHIPLETAKGHYLFIDEQAEYNKKYPKRSGYDTSKPFYERPSFDYIFGVFDESTGTIYVFRMNT